MTVEQVSRGRMHGKVAIVTGAGGADGSVAIGNAIAMLMAREGAMVVCVDLDEARAQDTARVIEAEGGAAIAQAGDVTRSEDCARFVEAAVRQFGHLDTLVNNVGLTTPISLKSPDMAAWSKVFETNVTGTMLMCHHALPAMISAGGGSIVNISSIAGIRTMGGLAYGPSKAAVHQFSCEVAVAHGREGIRANTVAPGHMATPNVLKMLPEGMREQRRKVSPLGIEGDGWDIANAVLFLASDEARFVTGVLLPVDGGVTVIGPLTGAALLRDDG